MPSFREDLPNCPRTLDEASGTLGYSCSIPTSRVLGQFIGSSRHSEIAEKRNGGIAGYQHQPSCTGIRPRVNLKIAQNQPKSHMIPTSSSNLLLDDHHLSVALFRHPGLAPQHQNQVQLLGSLQAVRRCRRHVGLRRASLTRTGQPSPQAWPAGPNWLVGMVQPYVGPNIRPAGLEPRWILVLIQLGSSRIASSQYLVHYACLLLCNACT